MKGEDILPTLHQFFGPLSKLERDLLLEEIMAALQKIRNAVISSNGLFYASSILLIYDRNNIRHIKCKMIDFVHCQILPEKEGSVIDTNYLEGLDSFISYLSLLK